MVAFWLKMKGWFLAAGVALLTLVSAFLYGRRKGTDSESQRRDAGDKHELEQRIEQRQGEQQQVQEVKNDVNSMSDADVSKRGDDKWMRD